MNKANSIEEIKQIGEVFSETINKVFKNLNPKPNPKYQSLEELFTAYDNKEIDYTNLQIEVSELLSLVYDEGLNHSYNYGFNRGLLEFKHKVDMELNELLDKVEDNLEIKEKEDVEE